MNGSRYAYSTKPTRNPFRYGLALWRALADPANTSEVAIVEMGFARSRFGRRFARWDEVMQALESDPRTGEAMRVRRRAEWIDLHILE
jgi:hypothetical protein